ncbi:MAG TPA: hypothetical protein VEJ22_04335 [Nitrospirota bacterium]|nr:hypothetical protein [Nitrospirota bacterium]
MRHDITRYQAKAFADILLFMIMATGLFALVVHGPAARRTSNGGIAVNQSFHHALPFDFKFPYGVKAVPSLQVTEITR